MDSLELIIIIGSIVFVRSRVTSYWKKLTCYVLMAIFLSLYSMVLLEKYNFVVGFTIKVLFAIMVDAATTITIRWFRELRSKYKGKGFREVVHNELEEYYLINEKGNAVYVNLFKKISGYNLFMRSQSRLKILKWVEIANIKFHKGTLTHKVLLLIASILSIMYLILDGFYRLTVLVLALFSSKT